MNDKEKKLREALNEYFGRDVGDVKGCFIDPASPTDYVPECPVDHTKQITILTKQHVPTFAERRKKLVDQLDKDLKEIDDGFGAQVISSDGEILIHVGHAKIAELYWDWAINEFHMHVFPIEISVITVVKIMDAVSVFTQELKRLKEQYKDETI